MSEQTVGHELRELVDRDRVAALVDRYVDTLDAAGPFDDAWARSLFTEEVRLEHEIATLTGVAEVAAAHQVVMGRWAGTFHVSGNHRVTIDGDRAHLTARLVAIHLHPGEDPPDPLIAANLLEGDAVRTADGWRLERFAPRTVWRCGTPAGEE